MIDSAGAICLMSVIETNKTMNTADTMPLTSVDHTMPEENG